MSLDTWVSKLQPWSFIVKQQMSQPTFENLDQILVLMPPNVTDGTFRQNINYFEWNLSSYTKV